MRSSDRGTKIVKMGPKPRLVRQSKDDLAWEKSDEAFDAWEASLHNKTMYRAIGNFILKHKPGEAAELHKPIMAGYNILYRLEYKDGLSVALRVPCKGMSRRFSALPCTD